MSDVKQIINAKIAGKKVMVFSKTTCPYCKMAKTALRKHLGTEITNNDMEIWEIERDPKCQQIQKELQKMTGASSVPRVFINGKCIGGGSETTAMEKSGELSRLLKAA